MSDRVKAVAQLHNKKQAVAALLICVHFSPLGFCIVSLYERIGNLLNFRIIPMEICHQRMFALISHRKVCFHQG